MTCLDHVCLTQDLERIAEADELFDAVLTGSVDQEKNVARKVAAAAAAMDSSEEKPKSMTVKSQKGGAVKRKLSLYIGNFPWVRFNSHSIIDDLIFLSVTNVCSSSGHLTETLCAWLKDLE